MFDPLHADQRIGHFLDFSPSPLDDQDLEAMVMVEMDMHAGKNLPLVVMLDVSQLAGQISHMMIIDKGNGPDGFFVLIPFLPDQAVPNQVAKRLRSIGIVTPPDVAVEFVEQPLVKRHTESDELIHRNLHCMVARFKYS